MHEGPRESQAAPQQAPADRQQSVAERRRHKRFLEEVRVRYRDLEGVDPSRWGRSRDLSLGGVGLVSIEEIELGSHLAVEIHIENETAPILALGRVVRCEEKLVDDEGEPCFGSGVQFIWISEEDRDNLRRLAEYFKKTYGETGDLEPA